MIIKMRNLIDKLKQWCYEYYVLNKPSVSDAEYDKEFDKLVELENNTGLIYSDSPTQTVGASVVQTKFNKVKHNHSMLSLDKTKTTEGVWKFSQGKDIIAMWKGDGLTVSLLYDKDGWLVQGETRGDGIEGEDVTENVKQISNIPKRIKTTKEVIVDGEVICKTNVFNEINSKLPEEERYAHVRNYASGSLRQLDPNVTKERQLSFIAWDLIDNDTIIIKNFKDRLDTLSILGFETVMSMYFDASLDYQDKELEEIDYCNQELKNLAIDCNIPIDGIVWKYNDIEFGIAQGQTSHHFKNGIAFKFGNEEVETTLRDVIWKVGKTGLVAPTAIFDPVIIEGTEVSKATLHNVSIMKDLEIGIGDKITIIKANEIIPKVTDNLTRSNNYTFPAICPCCHQPLNHKIDEDSEVETLWCENLDCPEKNLSKFTQFVSKQGMNIDGLSENKLAALIKAGYITDFLSIYHLKDHPEIANLEGFGKKSYEKLIDAIEKSRTVKMNNVLVALCIPNVGKTVAKTLYKAFKGNFMEFIWACHGDYDFSVFDDIGKVINDSIYAWYKNPSKIDEKFIFAIQDDELLIFDTSEFNNVQTKDMISGDNDFCVGKNFVVTGKFNKYKRDEIGKMIEDRGGKLIGSVSKKTSILLTNDGESGSSKAEKAKELNIPIMSEDEFLNAIGVG